MFCAPSTSNQLSHTGLSRASTPLSLDSSRVVEDIAVQRHLYFTTFEEHASAIRGSPDLALAYQRVLNGRQALSPDTPWKKLTDEEHRERQRAMEQILARPVDTIDGHLLVCFAANTLLHLQRNTMKGLPARMTREIDVRTNQLRRGGNLVAQREQFGPLVPSSPLPEFHRPSTNYCLHPITRDGANDLLASPSSLVGWQFILTEPGLFYRISSVERTLDGYRFYVQYENVRLADVVDFGGMKQMLQSSNTVEV